MAFDINSIVGGWNASYIEAINNPPDYSIGADGSFTISNLNARGDFQDANAGYPTNQSPHDTSGAGLQSFDSAGESIALYSTITSVVLQTDLDYQGMARPGTVGYKVVAYNPTGFILQNINGFFPINPATGTYGGTLKPLYELYTFNTVLDTFDAAGNPIVPNYSVPQVFEPLSFNFSTVPEPSMGLVIGLIAAAVMVARMFGRARAV